MGSGGKEKGKVARAEAVQRLRTLATQLEQGTIILGNKAFPVPEEVRLEVDADSGELEIELKWRTSAMAEPSEAKEEAAAEEEEREEEEPGAGEHAPPG